MLNYIYLHPSIEILIVVLLGLFYGSFSTAIIYRTRHQQSWIWNAKREEKARSFCPKCGHTLGIKDLIPIFSWAIQKGNCRYCCAKIPSEYVLTEIFMVGICLMIYLALGLNILSITLMTLMPFFLSQGVLTVKYKILSKLLLSIILAGGIFIAFLWFTLV